MKTNLVNEAYNVLVGKNEAKLQAGPDIYKKIKLGDTVVNSDGEEITFSLPLDNGSASEVSRGLIEIIKYSSLLGDKSTVYLSKAEIKAIAKRFF